MRTKILFLDFDGVLNHQAWVIDNAERISEAETLTGLRSLDPECVQRLEQVCRRTGCYIVVSSSWRLSRSVEELGALLRQLGCTADVIDKTPVIHTNEAIDRFKRGEDPEEFLQKLTRGHEIQRWMDASGYTNTDHIAIVDDDSDMAHLKHRLVQTRWESGLQDEHVERLVALLGEKR